jgi:hypothetical protein
MLLSFPKASVGNLDMHELDPRLKHSGITFGLMSYLQ